jgi:hypothetical protein
MEKIKLVESFNLPTNGIKIEEFNGEMLTEAQGETYKAKGVIRGIPCTNWKKNLNGRLYPRSLWEKVLKEGEGSLAFLDHADGEPSLKNLTAVWKNARIDEKNECVRADAYLIGQRGAEILEAVKLNGKIGTSTVGYGVYEENPYELDKYPEAKEGVKIVKTEDYELSSWGDFVVTPSAQGAYANYGIVEDSTQKETKNTQIEENITNKKETTNSIETFTNKSEINENEVIKMDKLQEMTFKNHVNHVLKLAEDKTPIEAIGMLQGIEVPVEMEVVQSKISESISKYEVMIEAERKATQEKLNEKTDKVESLEKELAEKESKVTELTEAVEKADAVLKEAGATEVSELKENFETLKENFEKIEGDKEKLISERANMVDDLKKFVEQTEMRDFDIKKLKEEKNKFQEDSKTLYDKLMEAEGYIKSANENLKEYGFEWIVEEADKDKEDEDDKSKEDKDEDAKKGDDKEDKEDKDADDKDKKKDKEDEDDKKDAKKESVIPEIDEIAFIYEKKAKEFPMLENYKEEILESATAYEAVKKIIDLVEKNSEKNSTTFKFNENVKVKEYKFGEQ